MIDRWSQDLYLKVSELWLSNCCKDIRNGGTRTVQHLVQDIIVAYVARAILMFLILAFPSSHKNALRALCKQNPFGDRVRYQRKVDENDWSYYPALFADSAYTSWLTDDADKLLWIYGNDGLGKTPFTIALIDELKNRVERSSKRRVLAYCFCDRENEERNKAIAIVRCLLFQVLCQRPEGFQPWLDRYHDSAVELFAPRAPLVISDLWTILQQTLVAAEIEIAYFLLYLPEECGPSFSDGYPRLFDTRMDSNCSIKWVVVSKLSPSTDHPYSQIDLARASHAQTPHRDSSPQQPPSTPMSPQAQDSVSSGARKSSVSSAPGLTLPPAREPSKIIKLVNV